MEIKMHSRVIAHNEVMSLVRERTVLLLLVIFLFMTFLSAYIGWSSHHTIQQIYLASVEQLQIQGKEVPRAPFADTTPLSLLKNMIIYIVLIGSLLAITIGHDAGMRERKAGVVKILFSRPVSKTEFLTGKIAGLIIVLGTTMLLAAGVSTVSSAMLANITTHDVIMLLVFYGFSLIYLLGFALLGLSFSLVEENDAMALLIPVIIWLSLAFVLPEFTSALYPTGSLNPTTSQMAISHGTILQAISDAVKPFSIAEHYKEMGSYLLEVQGSKLSLGEILHLQALNLAAVVSWLLICLLGCFAAMQRFDTSSGDLHA
jgi:ABC-type transport system involved in multi-copper enzyme maturation permease subunit